MKIELDKLIEEWARLFDKTRGGNGKYKLHFSEQLENDKEKKEFHDVFDKKNNHNLENRSKEEHPGINWPPEIKLSSKIINVSRVEPVKENKAHDTKQPSPEESWQEIDSSEKIAQIETGILKKIDYTASSSKTVSTKLTLTASAEGGVGPIKLGRLTLAIERAEATTSGTQETDSESNSNTMRLTEIKLQKDVSLFVKKGPAAYQAKIAVIVQGFVAIKLSKLDKDHKKEHRKRLVPISQVLADLKQYASPNTPSDLRLSDELAKQVMEIRETEVKDGIFFETDLIVKIGNYFSIKRYLKKEQAPAFEENFLKIRPALLKRYRDGFETTRLNNEVFNSNDFIELTIKNKTEDPVTVEGLTEIISGVGKILLLGPPGAGKSTLCSYLLSKLSERISKQSPLPSQYFWPFLLKVDQLGNYEKKNRLDIDPLPEELNQYSSEERWLAEIIFAECFTKDNIPGINLVSIKETYPNFLRKKILELLKHSCILIDGLDERKEACNGAWPEELKVITRHHHTVTASRDHGLADLGEIVDVNKSFTLNGFKDDNCLNTAINQLLPGAQNSENAERRKRAEQVIGEDAAIRKLCHTPIMCEILCTIILENNDLDLNKGKYSFFEEMMKFHLIRYKRKNFPGSETVQETANDDLTTLLLPELSLLDYCGFLSKIQEKPKLKDAKEYVRKILEIKVANNSATQQNHMGFIKPIFAYTNLNETNSFTFYDKDFEVFYEARYLLGCILKKENIDKIHIPTNINPGHEFYSPEKLNNKTEASHLKSLDAYLLFLCHGNSPTITMLRETRNETVLTYLTRLLSPPKVETQAPSPQEEITRQKEIDLERRLADLQKKEEELTRREATIKEKEKLLDQQTATNQNNPQGQKEIRIANNPYTQFSTAQKVLAGVSAVAAISLALYKLQS